MTFKAPLATAVVMGTPGGGGFVPTTWESTVAAGRFIMSTVREPTIIAPTHATPDNAFPSTEAGIPPMSTVGTPGPVMVSPVAVVSPTLAAGPGILSSPMTVDCS